MEVGVVGVFVVGRGPGDADLAQGADAGRAAAAAVDLPVGVEIVEIVPREGIVLGALALVEGDVRQLPVTLAQHLLVRVVFGDREAVALPPLRQSLVLLAAYLGHGAPVSTGNAAPAGTGARRRRPFSDRRAVPCLGRLSVSEPVGGGF